MCDHHFPGQVCIPDPAHINPDGTGVPVISLDANNGDVIVGGPAGGLGHRGRLALTDAAGNVTYEIDGATGTTSQSGDIVLLDAAGNERVRISGKTAEVIIKSAAGDQVLRLDGKVGDLSLGGAGQDGDVIVRNSAGDETIRLDGGSGDISAGGAGQDGDVIVRNSAGDETIRLDGGAGNLTLDGEIVIKDWSISVPDYVFSADYPLRRLDELASYVGVNHHLPDVPSAAEIARHGVNVGEFCMLLLKKLEEMSLYAIQQERTIQQQSARLARLEHRLSV
jgi:hypothetical protein